METEEKDSALSTTKRLDVKELQTGWKLALGPEQLTETEIIEFAKITDPQPLHIDPTYAATTRFGGIIASGLHPYIKFHTKYWVEMMRDHFICGVTVDGAQFFLPVYPEMPIYSELKIIQTIVKPEKGSQLVSWEWNFYDEARKHLLFFKFTTYHKL
jgi:acyl dehydratase